MFVNIIINMNNTHIIYLISIELIFECHKTSRNLIIENLNYN